jgi:hypothetical protein
MDIKPAENIANLFRLLLRLRAISRPFMLDAIDTLQVKVFEDWQKRVSDGIDRNI